MKNLKEKLKQKSGITLLALVIKIIILIILAAVSINFIFGERGIIARAQNSGLEQKKAQYFEEIELEIMAEQIDWKESPKEGTTFIESIGSRIKTNIDWAVDYEVEDENTLIIKTVEGYEIPVTVNSLEVAASIDKNEFSTEPRNCKIRYDANTGTGEMQEQTIKKGETITLTANAFKKSGNHLKEWNTKSDGSGTSYNDGATFEVDKTMTLYAIWEQSAILKDIIIGNDYGKLINYSVTVNGTELNSWRVLMKSSGKIYIIYSGDFSNSLLPSDCPSFSSMTSEENLNTFLSYLRNTNKWSFLLNEYGNLAYGAPYVSWLKENYNNAPGNKYGTHNFESSFPIYSDEPVIFRVGGCNHATLDGGMRDTSKGVSPYIWAVQRDGDAYFTYKGPRWGQTWFNWYNCAWPVIVLKNDVRGRIVGNNIFID